MINKWISNIVAVAVLGVLLDMVLPTGNFKTYTRFFLGLMMIIVILQPLLNISQDLPNLEKFIGAQTMGMELETLNAQSQTIQEDQNDYLMDLYKRRLEAHAVSEVQQFVRDSSIIAKIELERNQDEESYNIHSINIMIGYSDLLDIEPIEIKIEPKSQEQEVITNRKDEGKDFHPIIEHLSQVYGVEESKIFIKTKLES